MTRVLIVDDHAVVRLGLRSIVEGQPDLQVCGAAADGEGGVLLARATRPDVVIMDLSMPGMGGLAAMRAILAERPQTRVLVLTWHADPGHVRDAVDAGAVGYVLKGDDHLELLQAVRAVHQGETWVSNGVGPEPGPL